MDFYSQSYVFFQYSCTNVRINYTKSWAPNNWYFQTVVLEKTLESPLDCEETKPVSPKGNQPRIFIRRTDAEDETLIIWPPDVKSQLIRKDPDVRKNWRQEEKGTTEDEMVEWHHQINEYELGKLWEMVKDRKTWCATFHGGHK